MTTAPLLPDNIAVVQEQLAPAYHILKSHIAALSQMQQDMNLHLLHIASHIAACQGQMIITGLGKSAIAARKISASLSSHGIASSFLHASDALHGDMGIIGSDDILIAISASGMTAELLPIVRHAGEIGTETIAITAHRESPLGNACRHVIALPNGEEGCAFGVAPFASTIATIAMGDVLTALVAKKRQFSREKMGRLHPGGHIGRQLAPVSETMVCGDRIPVVTPHCNIEQVISEITAKGLGVVAVAKEQRELLGIITDGDLRRHYTGLDEIDAASIMSSDPVTVEAEQDHHQALILMRNHRVSVLPVVDKDGRTLRGMIHLQDILRTGAIIG